MPQVQISGIYMGAAIQMGKQYQDRKTEDSVMIDIYQHDSPDQDKLIRIKVDKMDLLPYFESNYHPMHDSIVVKASVNAYQGKAYFKYLEDVTGDQPKVKSA